MKRNKTYCGKMWPTWGKHLLVSFTILAICNFSIPWGSLAAAEEVQFQDQAVDAGLNLASLFLTIPYGGAKILYAAVGGIVGGVTWALTGGDVETAKLVWHPSLYGTYVIAPEHLRGEDAIQFMGVPPYESPILK